MWDYNKQPASSYGYNGYTAPPQQTTTIQQKPVYRMNDDAYHIDVLCMNCQQMVYVEDIDKHSLTCFKVSDSVFKVESNVSMKQLDFKLDKLKEAINVQLGQNNPFKTKEEKGKDALYSNLIIDYINKILTFGDRCDIKQVKLLKNVIDEIQKVTENFNGPPGLLIYFERVKILGREKYREMLKIDKESIPSWNDPNFGTAISPQQSPYTAQNTNSYNQPSSTYSRTPQTTTTTTYANNQERSTMAPNDRDGLQVFQNPMFGTKSEPQPQPTIIAQAPRKDSSSREAPKAQPRTNYHEATTTTPYSSTPYTTTTYSNPTTYTSSNNISSSYQWDKLVIKSNNGYPEYNNNYSFPQQTITYNQQGYPTQYGGNTTQYSQPSQTTTSNSYGYSQPPQQQTTTQSYSYNAPQQTTTASYQQYSSPAPVTTQQLQYNPQTGTYSYVSATSPTSPYTPSVDEGQRITNGNNAVRNNNYYAGPTTTTTQVQPSYSQSTYQPATTTTYSQSNQYSNSVASYEPPKTTTYNNTPAPTTTQSQQSYVLEAKPRPPIQRQTSSNRNTEGRKPQQQVQQQQSPMQPQNQSQRNSESVEQQRPSMVGPFGDKESVKQKLEMKLEMKKKEVEEINKLVDAYKNKTQIMQNVINQNYGLDPRRSSEVGDRGSSKRSLSPISSISQLPGGSNRDSGSKPASVSNFESPRLTQQYLSKLTGTYEQDPIYLRPNIIAYNNQLIDDVRSDVDGRQALSSKYSESIDTNSNMDGYSVKDSKMLNEIKELDEMFATETNQTVDKNQEDQRLFYSKCLALKMKMSSKDLAQHIPVVLLFKAALERGLPKEKWEGFIKDAFARPQEFIDVGKIRNKKKPGFQNKLSEIARKKQTQRGLMSDFDIIKE
jgi:hypothetical protein